MDLVTFPSKSCPPPRGMRVGISQGNRLKQIWNMAWLDFLGMGKLCVIDLALILRFRDV